MLMLIWNEKESISTHNIVSNPGMKAISKLFLNEVGLDLIQTKHVDY